MLFIGPEAEKHFGRRHFMELTASFTAPPEFTVLAGRTEIGTTDPSVLTEERQGPRRLLLAGRSWQVTFIDWARRRAFVEPVEDGGVAKWQGSEARGLSYALTRAMRDVLLGTDPDVKLTRRATATLAELRMDRAPHEVHPAGTLLVRDADAARWWTWTGYRANATLASSLGNLADPVQRPTDTHIRLRQDLSLADWKAARAELPDSLTLPTVDPRAVRGLKFSVALPPRIATATLAERLADFDGALAAAQEPVRVEWGG